jgi:hypothetical protein
MGRASPNLGCPGIDPARPFICASARALFGRQGRGGALTQDIRRSDDCSCATIHLRVCTRPIGDAGSSRHPVAGHPEVGRLLLRDASSAPFAREACRLGEHSDFERYCEARHRPSVRTHARTPEPLRSAGSWIGPSSMRRLSEPSSLTRPAGSSHGASFGWSGGRRSAGRSFVWRAPSGITPAGRSRRR